MRSWESSVSFVFFSLTVLVGLYTVIQVVMFPFQFQTGLNQRDNHPRILEVTVLEPLNIYQEKFSTHNLFSKSRTEFAAPSTNFSELLKSYLLTGIIRAAEPEALIQNNVTKQMYFVQTGEQFDQFTLTEIKEHSILVEFQGEQLELHIEEGR